MKNFMRLYSTRLQEYYQKGVIDRILTQLNNLYLSNKITARDYTKLEKLIDSGDTENIKMVEVILNSKS